MNLKTQPVTLAISLCLFLWPSTRIAAQVLIRISEEETAHQVTEISGEVWLAMKSGAFRVRENATEAVLPDQEVTTIASDGRHVLLGTRRAGVFSFDSNQTQQIYGDEIAERWITNITTSEATIWLGTNRALYRSRGIDATPVLESQFVNSVKLIGGDVWVATSRNAYRIKGTSTAHAFFPEDTAVADIFEAAGSVYLITEPRGIGYYGPCFQIDGDEVSPFLEDDVVFTVADVTNTAWLATKNGVFRREGRYLTTLAIEALDEREFVDIIWADRNEIWLGSSQSAYRGTEKNFVAVPSSAKHLGITGIDRAGGHVWLWGETGAYRFDNDVEIHFSIHSWQLGSTFRPGEALYEFEGTEAYQGDLKGDFEVILEADRTRFEGMVREGKFAPVEALERRLSWGRPTLHWMVEDRFGNRTARRSSPVIVVPYFALLLFLLLLVLVFALARTTRALLRKRKTRRFAMEVVQLLKRFRECCQFITEKVENEEAVQRILWMLLRTHSDQLVREEHFRKFGAQGYIPDFGVPEGKVLVEAKYVGAKTKLRDIQEAILADVSGYLKGNRDYDSIIVFVYDAGQQLRDPRKFKVDIGQVQGVLAVIVVPGID